MKRLFTLLDALTFVFGHFGSIVFIVRFGNSFSNPTLDRPWNAGTAINFDGGYWRVTGIDGRVVVHCLASSPAFGNGIDYIIKL